MTNKDQKVKRPKKIELDGIHCRAVRGPREGGQWYWRAESYADSSSRTIWTGWATPGEAAATVATLVRGETPADSSECTTIRDLLELFLGDYASRPDVAEATIKGLRSRAKEIVRMIGSVRLDRLDARTMDDLRNKQLAHGSAIVLQKQVKLLVQAWRWGQPRGYTPDRALPRPQFRAERATPVVTPDADDIWRALDALDGAAKAPAWARIMGILLAATGARPGGVASLPWSSVDFERSQIRIVDKTGPRLVPVADDVLEVLKVWQPDPDKREGSVLGCSPMTARDNFSIYWGRACEAAGIPKCEPYALRRAAVDALYRSGADIGAASAVLGHSATTAIQAYRRATEGDKRRAVALAGLGSRPAPKVVELATRRAKS